MSLVADDQFELRQADLLSLTHGVDRLISGKNDGEAWGFFVFFRLLLERLKLRNQLPCVSCGGESQIVNSYFTGVIVMSCASLTDADVRTDSQTVNRICGFCRPLAKRLRK